MECFVVYIVAESGQESWTTSLNNRIIGGGVVGGTGAGAGAGAGGSGGCFRAAIVGVAKHSHSHADYPSLNPLLPDILSPRQESEPIQGERPQMKMSFQNYGRHSSAVVKSGASKSGAQESKIIDNAHKISAWGEGSIHGKQPDDLNIVLTICLLVLLTRFHSPLYFKSSFTSSQILLMHTPTLILIL